MPTSIVKTRQIGRRLQPTGDTGKGLRRTRVRLAATKRAAMRALKATVEEFKRAETQRLGLATTRDSEIRDALIYLTQSAASRENGRPKGRAFIDLTRAQIPREESAKLASNIVLLS